VSLAVASDKHFAPALIMEADDVVCTPETMLRFAISLALLSSATLYAQQPAPAGVPGELAPRGAASMGTVPTRDALVTGGLEVRGDSARLLTNASVTAYDHSAAISLARGGQVLVCATSQFHLLHSGTENSLLFGLDRGAIEIHSPTQPQDVILTPDIRFTLEHPGHYDLRLRVTPNGDTCVENSGTTAPVLTLADPFSGATYRLIPGQHVLFEHGNLHEVVDNDLSPATARSASRLNPRDSHPAHHPGHRRRRTPLPSRRQPGPRSHRARHQRP